MEDKLLDISELSEYLHISRAGFYNLKKKKGFPKPVLVLEKKLWKKSEIDEYLDSTRSVGSSD
jgi:predicted DNA-binding transcriptional regulator AlpA